MRQFTDRNGKLPYRELLGDAVVTSEVLSTVRERDPFRTVCPKFVKDTGKIPQWLLSAIQ